MMRTWTTLAVLCLLSFAPMGYSQDASAPLYLFTQGNGSISPSQSGQMLEVGQTYIITATPGPGYEFKSWQPVNVFIFVQTNFDSGGNPILPPVETIVPSAVPTNIYGADLDFTLQDVTVLSADGSNPSITLTSGWQADFVPLPQPADITGLSVNGPALTIAATNGAVSGPFTLVQSASLLLPPGQWTPVLTNHFDLNGNVNLTTNVINPGAPAEFYLIEQP